MFITIGSAVLGMSTHKYSWRRHQDCLFIFQAVKMVRGVMPQSCWVGHSISISAGSNESKLGLGLDKQKEGLISMGLIHLLFRCIGESTHLFT